MYNRKFNNGDLVKNNHGYKFLIWWDGHKLKISPIHEGTTYNYEPCLMDENLTFVKKMF